MDEYEAIDLLDGIVKSMPVGKLTDAMQLALDALKEKIGYCAECRIDYSESQRCDTGG